MRRAVRGERPDFVRCSVHADGAVALHTRSLKYGRLANGQLVRAPPTLVKRVKRHFHAVDPSAFGGGRRRRPAAEETTGKTKICDDDRPGDRRSVWRCSRVLGFVWVGARPRRRARASFPRPERTEGKNANEKTTRLVVSRARAAGAAAAWPTPCAFVRVVPGHTPARHRGRRALLGRWGTDPKDMLGDAFLRRTLLRTGAVRQGARDVFDTRRRKRLPVVTHGVAVTNTYADDAVV